MLTKPAQALKAHADAMATQIGDAHNTVLCAGTRLTIVHHHQRGCRTGHYGQTEDFPGMA